MIIKSYGSKISFNRYSIYIYILFKLNSIPYKNAYYVNLEIASTSIETYI